VVDSEVRLPYLFAKLDSAWDITYIVFSIGNQSYNILGDWNYSEGIVIPYVNFTSGLDLWIEDLIIGQIHLGFEGISFKGNRQLLSNCAFGAISRKHIVVHLLYWSFAAFANFYYYFIHI
jgi:hypothetical protein